MTYVQVKYFHMLDLYLLCLHFKQYYPIVRQWLELFLPLNKMPAGGLRLYQLIHWLVIPHVVVLRSMILYEAVGDSKQLSVCDVLASVYVYRHPEHSCVASI